MNGFFEKVKKRVFWKVFYFLPIINKNKIVVQSYYGRGYSDNPKYIVEEILKQNPNFKIYWNVSDISNDNNLPKGVVPLKMNSMRSIYHMCTAKVWIDNCRKYYFINKKKKQIYIQTWHGFGVKRIEKDVEENLDPGYIRMAKKDSKMCDLLISNSELLTQIYRNCFWYDGEILECGSPRNDIFFVDNSKRIDSIRSKIGVGPNDKILLYAPTFRKNFGLEQYDIYYELLVNSLKKKFGDEWKILIRLHPNIAKKSKELNLNQDFIIDVSNYDDIQELMLASNVLITDYSSSMFDFALTKKPCFLYANDISQYKDDRNFYFDIDKLPFPLACNNNELEEKILNFDPDRYKEDIEKFLIDFKFNESGSAAKSILCWLRNHI